MVSYLIVLFLPTPPPPEMAATGLYRMKPPLGLRPRGLQHDYLFFLLTKLLPPIECIFIPSSCLNKPGRQTLVPNLPQQQASHFQGRQQESVSCLEMGGVLERRVVLLLWTAWLRAS